MVECIILDGYHRGQTLSADYAPPVIFLPIQQFRSQVGKSASFTSYDLVYTSIDEQTALYAKGDGADAIKAAVQAPH